MNILNTTQVPRDFSKYSLSREDYALYKNVQNILKQKNVQKEFINDFAENVVYLHKIYPQVDMKALYEKINRLNRLEEISHNPKDSFAARYFCTYLDKMGNDIGSVIEFKIQQNETTYMHNLDHEEVHLFATRLGPDKKPVDIGMGLTYTHEIWTEYTANRIAEIKSDLHMSDRNLLNRYRVKEVPSSKNIYEIALNESGNVAKFKVDSFGYMALLPYMNVLDKMYHEQFYSDNLNGTNILIDNKTDLFLNLEGCLETLYKIPSINAMKDTSDALSLIYIDYLHTNAKNLSTEEYFELQKSFLESNPSVNNRNLGFEAIQEGDIIFALSKLEGDFDLKREINPETRSFEVNAFLASLEYQKDSGDILNSKYAIKVSEGSLNIFFKQDEFIYKVKFENGKIVDNIELLEEPKDLAWTNFSQIPLFEVKKYNSFLKPIEHINSYGVIENVKFEELLNMSYSNKLELFQGNSLNQRVFKCLAFNNSKDIDLDEILIVMDDNSKDKDNRNLSYVLAMGSLSKNASSTLCDTIAKDVQNFDKIFFNKDNFGKDSFDYSLENSKDIVSSSIIKRFMVSDSNAELEKHLIDFNEFLIQHKESIKSNPDNFFAAMQLAVNSTYEDFTKKGYSEEYKNYVFSTFMNEANQSISFNEIKNSKGQNFLNYLESSLYTTNLYLEYSNCIKDDSFRKILLNNNFSPFEIDSYNETAYKHFLTNLKSQFINEDVLVNREFQKKLYEFVDAIPGTPPRNIIKILGKENIGYNVACDLAYKGLNVNDFCQEDSLVKIAVDRGDKNILGFLSHHDINLSKMVPSAGKTMLEYMNDKISLNTSKSASIRESMRAILNTENSAGSTGLYTVLMKPEVPADKKVELLDIARNLGGDFSKKDSSGLSLMDYTSDTKVILKLAECGVDARDYNNQDCTLNRF